LIVAAAALTVGLGVLVWQLTCDQSSQHTDQAAEGGGDTPKSSAGPRDGLLSQPQTGRDVAQPAEPARHGEPPSGAAPDDPASALSDVARNSLASPGGDPEANRKYPPSSRPLAGARRLHLHPTAGMEASKPLASPDAEGDDADRPLRYVLKADRNGVTGDDPLTLTLAVFDDAAGDSPRRVPVRVIEAGLRDAGPVTAMGIPLGKLEFNDDGRAGDPVARDHVHTCHFIPSDHELYPDGGFYFAHVVFAVQGHPRTEAQVAFLHTPEERVPARFTGSFADRVGSGSLLVSVEVDVLSAGDFLLAANLYDQRGTPLARASNLYALRPGKRTVDLTFYGLILREANVDGPYVVRFLRGHRTLSGEFPNRQDLPAFDGEHTTSAYGASEFSDQRWEDR